MAHEAVVTAFPPVEPKASGQILDRTLVRGVTWTGGIKGLTLLVSWVSTIIVARILSPDDYGLVAMATVYLGLTTMVTDFGLGSAIIALRELTPELTAQLHAVASIIGLSGFALSCVVAGPLSRFFGTPLLAGVVIVLSSALVLDSLRTVPAAMLARELRFKSLALLEGSKVMIAVACTLSLAAAGAGYWALILGNIAASLAITVYVLFRLPQRFARPRFATLKSTLTFSSHFLMGQLAWYGYSNADFVVAGRILGRTALGEYTLAWTLTSAPADKIMAVFGRVMPMMLAAVQRDLQALRRYFLLFTEVLALLIVPASAGLALVAPDFVLLLFGAKWAAVVVPLQLLCFYMAVHILATPITPVLQVTGQPHYPARCGLVTLAVLPPAFYFAGGEWGTLGIAAVWLTIYPLVLLPVYIRVFKTLELRVRDYAATIGATFAGAAVMAAVVLTARELFEASPVALRLAVQILAGAAAFFGAAWLLQRRRLTVLRVFVRA
ncbi:MAG TPA: lipopolysaccharide biosynthesis protein, partial [Thermoanaerobaculia bacterium]|nr:lipopolysaccharide biosynthesis protein [Thermoanaerobaculia bacterium]